MDPVLPTVTPSGTVTDGFGHRTNGIDAETGDEVELLEFTKEIVEHSGFVTALGERVARFSTVRHASYVHVRRLDRPSAVRLQLVSDLTQGWRLSEMVAESAGANIPIDITVVISLLRQLLPAVALFGRHNRDAAIGAISAHRLIVTPQSRLVIAEHVFGPAIEKLNLGRDKLWREFAVSMPPSTGLPRANQRGDAMAVGVVALTLLLGRALDVDEFPGQLQDLVDAAQEYRGGQTSPLSSSFSNWLKRTLQFDANNAFQTPSEAQVAFESVLASDRSYVTTSPAFIEWVSRVGITIENKRPKPEKVEAPPPPAPVAADSRENELRRRLEEAASVREVRPEPEPEREPEPSLLVGSNGATIQVVEPEPVSVPEPVAVVEPEPEPVEEVNLLEELDPQPVAIAQPASEPEPTEPPPAQPRIEDDPIALQLLTYKPKDFAEPPPPVREPDPEPEPETQPEVEAPPEVEAQPESDDAREAEPEPVAVQEPQEEEEPPREEVLQHEATEEEALPEPEEEPARKPRLYTPPPPPPPEPVTSDEEPSTDEPDEPVEEPRVPMAPAAEVFTSPPPVEYAAEASSDEAPSRGLFRNPLVLGLAGVVIVLVGVMGWLLTRDTGGGMRAGEGELVVQSRPEGAQVKIDGEVKGNTPLTVRLNSGAHVLEVQSGKSEPRVIPLMIQAGVQTSQYVELQGVAKTGVLEIRSEPPGARVTIDGRPRGTTPVTVRDLTPGDHTVVLEAGGRKAQETVRIEAGGTAQLSVPMPRK